MATMQRMTGLGRNTRITRDPHNGAIVVTLYDTPIVTVVPAGAAPAWLTGGEGRGFVTLDSGGHQTATTKARMNQVSNELGLGFGVYQEDYAWYVSYAGNDRVPFCDGMSFPTA